MRTRREAAILSVGIPLLATAALAQDRDVSVDELFKRASEEMLKRPDQVYWKYSDFRFYIELVIRYEKLAADDIGAAIKTAELVLRAIQENKAQFMPKFVQIEKELKDEFAKLRGELVHFLSRIGIEGRS